MIILEKSLADVVIGHCKKEYPNEACGILAGPPSRIGSFREDSVRRVTKVYEMTNADRSAATFLMDPKEQLKVMKELRALNLDMIAIYHSHVASRAHPSSHDVEMAFYPETSYVIVSLENRDNPVIKSFRIVDRKITEEGINLE